LTSIALRREEDFGPGEKPTVSLVVVAHHDLNLKNLESVLPHVEELVVVLVEPHQTWLEGWDPQLRGRDLVRQLICIDPSSHPHLFSKDVAETYQAGSPLAGETYQGPFSGRKFVADWSAVANLGWSRCSQEWRLLLDQHETLLDPDHLAGACELMAAHRSTLGYGRRQYLGGSHLVPMLSANLPEIRWEGAAAPTLAGGCSPVIFDGCLRTSYPLRQSDQLALGATETFCALYAEARRRDWDVPPSSLVHLARCARYVGMDALALPAIDAYLDASLYTEERAWACAVRGEVHESRGEFAEASRWHERSLAEHDGWKSAHRLCRSRFHERKWQECIDARELAIYRGGFAHLVDDGQLSDVASLILVVAALHQLGKDDLASLHLPTLQGHFPQSEKVAELCRAVSRL
jgi:hypothetical protein